jgi:hypothetical protein
MVVQNRFKSEIATIKGAAFGMVIGALWAMAKQVLLPPARQIEDAITKPAAQPNRQPTNYEPSFHFKINRRSEL